MNTTARQERILADILGKIIRADILGNTISHIRSKKRKCGDERRIITVACLPIFNKLNKSDKPQDKFSDTHREKNNFSPHFIDQVRPNFDRHVL